MVDLSRDRAEMPRKIKRNVVKVDFRGRKAIRRVSSAPAEDLAGLGKQMVLDISILNTDDQLQMNYPGPALRRTTLNELYHSDIRYKLPLALHLYQQEGEPLLALPAMRQALATLEERHQRLVEQMEALNLALLCTQCAGRSGGGCCSREMADENDAVLLLINLLAGGRPFFAREDDDGECSFLGGQGCILRFKPMFCLNYNCHAIRSPGETTTLTSYLAASGQLLQGQWQAETVILAHLARRSPKR